MGLSRQQVPLCDERVAAPGAVPVTLLLSRRRRARSSVSCDPASLRRPPDRVGCGCDGRLRAAVPTAPPVRPPAPQSGPVLSREFGKIRNRLSLGALILRVPRTVETRIRPPCLLLQLRIGAGFSMRSGGGRLMCSSPERPSENERVRRGGSKYKTGNQSEDFGGRKKSGRCIYLGLQKAYTLRPVAGLVLFTFPNALRRWFALSFARNAAAAITRLICRCQPCQERASQ